MGSATARRAMDLYSENSLSLLVRPDHLLGVGGAFAVRGLRFRRPEGPPENVIRTDFCAECRIKFQFQEVGALPWLPGRRNGLARRIYHRLAADGRFPRKQIQTVVRYSLSTLPFASWYSAFQVAPGANPTKLYGRAGRWRRPDVCAGNLSSRSLSDSGNSA